MYAVKDGIIRHVNAEDIQPFIDDGYEIWDGNKKKVTGKRIQTAVNKELKAHEGG